MERKDNRDRESEEEYGFDYEELADADTDPEQEEQWEDPEQGRPDEYEIEAPDRMDRRKMGKPAEYDEDYGEYREEDDFDDDEGIAFRFKPWMIPAFAGMMILAVLICIPLWKLSHHDRNAENNEIAAVTTEAQTSELAFAETSKRETSETETAPEATAPEPESTSVPETAASESATAPTEASQTTPVPPTTPGAQPQSTEVPAATEPPADSNAGDALAEGNSMTFGDVNETVTAKDVSNLRSTPYTGDEGNVVGQLKNGETLTRTGRNDSTGWSRLEYNGQTVYAVSAYLTTDLTYKTPEKPTYPNRVSTQDGRVIVFTDCDDYITPKDLINLRTEPSTSEGESTVRTQVRNGTNLHRTGYSEGSGWSRVEYNGEILYAVTNYVISGSAPE